MTRLLPRQEHMHRSLLKEQGRATFLLVQRAQAQAPSITCSCSMQTRYHKGSVVPLSEG